MNEMDVKHGKKAYSEDANQSQSKLEKKEQQKHTKRQ